MSKKTGDGDISDSSSSRSSAPSVSVQANDPETYRDCLRILQWAQDDIDKKNKRMKTYFKTRHAEMRNETGTTIEAFWILRIAFLEVLAYLPIVGRVIKISLVEERADLEFFRDAFFHNA